MRQKSSRKRWNSEPIAWNLPFAVGILTPSAIVLNYQSLQAARGLKGLSAFRARRSDDPARKATEWIRSMIEEDDIYINCVHTCRNRDGERLVEKECVCPTKQIQHKL